MIQKWRFYPAFGKTFSQTVVRVSSSSPHAGSVRTFKLHIKFNIVPCCQWELLLQTLGKGGIKNKGKGQEVKGRRDFAPLIISQMHYGCNQSNGFFLFCSTSTGLLHIQNTRKTSEHVYKYKTVINKLASISRRLHQ